ncbi:MAG TPA: hypothetical protein ENI90_03480 [Methylothermaceae bacterium]|nr:hypothetical protein [Methylothermaceae bacterium]
MKRRGKIIMILAFAATLIVAAWLGVTEFNLLVDPEQLFADLPANRWQKISTARFLGWRRQGHGSAVIDPKRDKVYVFGSDTHNENWDNSVHEFDLTTLRWRTHYAPAAKSSYRADAAGRAVAGDDGVYPWAMHVFDNLVFDPRLDAVIVTARPEHNYEAHQIAPEARIHPTWIYHLGTRTWSILANDGKPYPRNFAGATAYDSFRDTIVLYKHGIYELGPNRRHWRLATKASHHNIHYNLVYDRIHRVFAVFGGKTDAVWLYWPDILPGRPGRWEQRRPDGDRCPADEAFPAAFSPHLGRFLIMPRDRKKQRRLACLYDVISNRYQRVPSADLPSVDTMNYMMVYDPIRRVFLLITGNWHRPVTVWALRLVPDLLP